MNPHPRPPYNGRQVDGSIRALLTTNFMTFPPYPPTKKLNVERVFEAMTPSDCGVQTDKKALMSSSEATDGRVW